MEQEQEERGFVVRVSANIGVRIDPKYPGEKVGNRALVKAGDTVRCTEVVSFQYQGVNILFYKLLDGGGWIHDYGPSRPGRTISRVGGPVLGNGGPPHEVEMSQPNVTGRRSTTNNSRPDRDTAYQNRDINAWALLMSGVRRRSTRGSSGGASPVSAAMGPPPPRTGEERRGGRAGNGDGKQVGSQTTRDNRRGDDGVESEGVACSPVASRTRTRNGKKSKRNKKNEKKEKDKNFTGDRVNRDKLSRGLETAVKVFLYF